MQQQPSFGEKCRMTMGEEKNTASRPPTLMARHQHVDIPYAKRKSRVSSLAKAIFFLD